MNKDCSHDWALGAVAVLGLASCFGWHDVMSDYLYVPSAGLAVSPMFVELACASLIVLWSLASYRLDSSLLSPVRAKAWFAAVAVFGTCAALLVSSGVAPIWSVYASSAVMGYAGASCIYLWAQALLRFESKYSLFVMFCALIVSSCAAWGFMVSGGVVSRLAAPAFCAVTCVCYFACLKRAAHSDGALLIRPRNTRSHARVAFGLTLYALALGVTLGTTGHVATEESISAINSNVATVAVVSACAFLLLWIVSRGWFSFLSALQVFTPFVVFAMLLNVVAIEWADAWLAVTLFAWRLLQLIAFGLLVEVSRRGIISLSLLFPAGWSALHGGCAVGVLVGQAVCPLFVSDERGVVVVVVAVALVIVVASVVVFGGGSSFLFSENLVGRESSFARCDSSVSSLSEASCEDREKKRISPGAGESGGAYGRSEGASAGKAPFEGASAPDDGLFSEISSDDAYAMACHELVGLHRLSRREEEVALLLARGHTRASIAKKLFVSENTVRAHVKNIYAKLGIHSKQQLIDLIESRTARL